MIEITGSIKIPVDDVDIEQAMLIPGAPVSIMRKSKTLQTIIAAIKTDAMTRLESICETYQHMMVFSSIQKEMHDKKEITFCVFTIRKKTLEEMANG